MNASIPDGMEANNYSANLKKSNKTIWRMNKKYFRIE